MIMIISFPLGVCVRVCVCVCVCVCVYVSAKRNNKYTKIMYLLIWMLLHDKWGEMFLRINHLKIVMAYLLNKFDMLI